MKQFLLSTKLGSLVLRFRDKASLLRFALVNPEAVGTFSNDILSTELITKICLPKKVFLDIGSHIGSIISQVQFNDSSIRIVGVEAIPEKVKNLNKHFPNIEIIECALGDQDGEATFYINEKASGYSSLLKPNNSSDNHITKITVPIKKLDDIFKTENIDAIKIDVEGAEINVIRGAKEIIRNNHPIVMFESASGDNAIKTELWDLFTSLNYGIHFPNRLAHDDIRISKEIFIDSHIYPRYTTNYFAVPYERRLEFRDRARKILKIGIP